MGNSKDTPHNVGNHLQPQYEVVCFRKDRVHLRDSALVSPAAEFPKSKGRGKLKHEN